MSVNPNCEECEGEGMVEYGGIAGESDGCRTMICQVCFPDGYEPEFED